MNAQHSIPAERKNKIRALAELRGMKGGRDGVLVARSHGAAKAEKNRRKRALAGVVDHSLEWRHALMDYRNDNAQIALVNLNRGQACDLNARLKGTGLAFAVCGGGNPNT